MKRHLILVGLPGSGKTTIGRLIRKLHPTDVTDFTDIDATVEQEVGCSIAAIFARDGETEFRRLEREAMDRALERPPHLIAAGGGWIAGPGNLEAAEARSALVVRLRIAPAALADRLGGAAGRPLLEAGNLGNLTRRLESLQQEREPWYARAAAEIDASGPPEQVARAVLTAARAHGAL